MVPPEAGERHTIGLAFALIIAQPKKRGKHARQIGCVEAASGKPKIPHSQSLPLEGEGGPKGRMRWYLTEMETELLCPVCFATCDLFYI